MKDVDLVVYQDSRYPSTYIDQDANYPDKIATYLENEGFRRFDANQLKEFMIKNIKRGEASEKLVLFSQDVIPDTIAEDYYSNTTFREFLDSGGNVVWIGDIPFFYIGREEGNLDQDAWKKGAPVHALGIIPLFAVPKQTVSLTDKGKELGLRRGWSGTRPVLDDEGIEPLAESEAITSTPFMNLEEKEGILERISSWFKKSRLKGIKASSLPPSFGAEFSPSEEEERRTTFHKTCINGWIKNYNPDYPNTGFLRIWDYGIRNLSNQMLKELFEIAKSFFKS